MKRVICFCRVSSYAQDLTAQRAAVMEAIKKDGFNEEEVAIVEGKESAIKLEEAERATLQEMNNVISEHPSITDIYFFAIDRLARKVSVVLSVVDKMTEKGICLHFLNPYPMRTLSGGKEDTTGKMFLTFLAIGAEMEMKMKMERFKTAKAEMKKNGQIHSGNASFGYYRDANGYPQIKEEEAEVVRYIFHAYLVEDKSFYQIGKDLVFSGHWKTNERGALTNKVGNIIKGKEYSGRKGKYPAIVDVETQEKAIALAKDRTRPKTEHKHMTALAQGIVTYIGEERPMQMLVYYADAVYRAAHDTIGSWKDYSLNIDVVDFVAWTEAKRLYYVLRNDKKWRGQEMLKQQVAQEKERLEQIAKVIEEMEAKQKKALKKAILADMSEEDIKEIKEHWEGQITPARKEQAQLLTSYYSHIDIISGYNEKETNKWWENDSLDSVTDIDVKKEIIREVIERIEVIKTGKWEYTITVIPSSSFQIGVVTNNWRYTMAGGKKHLYTRLNSNQEWEERTKEIVSRHKQIRNIKRALEKQQK